MAYSDNKTSVNCAKNEKANKNAITIIKIIFRPKIFTLKPAMNVQRGSRWG